MVRVIAGVLATLLFLVSYMPVAAEPKAERTVNCVYPGELLASALNDFAGQLGYRFEPGDMADAYELEAMIWVHAKGVSPDVAAQLISASGGVIVSVDDTNRTVLIREIDEEAPAASGVRSFKTDALCKLYTEYQKRYGMVAEGGLQPDMMYRPTATEELRDAVEEILQLGDSAPGSAVGMRLVYTRGTDDLDRVGELLQVMGAAGGGESSQLQVDRAYREKLAKVHSSFGGEGTLVSALLWQLFKDCDVPVYVDHAQMESFDLEYDTTDVTLDNSHNHYEALLELAREQDFFVDCKHGALRLHEDFFVGSSSFRVFDVAEVLAQLEKDYADLKTEDQVFEGFHGDLRSEGGVQVIVDALSVQLENAGFSPLLRAYGPRIAVVGGMDVVDRAAEVLEAMGWKPIRANEGEGK
ncbi:MAG: hypothetical protein KDB90_07705 [Planctomycetes bacterium]|nr:hypothetical protein [Planctomycetota bacterium]